jgi:hypothetical protein
MDGFDHYVTADVNLKWNLAASNASIISGGRFSNCLQLGNIFAGGQLTRLIDSQSTWIVGFAIKFQALFSSTLCSFIDNGTVQCDLRYNTSTNLFYVTRNGTNVTMASGSVVSILANNTWNYVEFKATIGSSIAANSCVVRLNGVVVATVAAGQNLQTTANSTANQVSLVDSTIPNNSSNVYYDDFYACDGTGTTNNDFLGDMKVVYLPPTGPGTTTQMTLGGTTPAATNWQSVNELAENADVNYVASSTVNNEDTYAMTDLSYTPVAIAGIQTILMARKDDAGTRSVARVVRSAGTDYVGSSVALGTTYNYLTEIVQQDPATSTAWTATGINSMEMGAKVTA